MAACRRPNTTVRLIFMSESQQFLYSLRPTRLEMLTEGPTDWEQAVVAEHFAYLQRLGKEGIVWIAGRTSDQGPDTVGIVILEVQDEVVAKQIMGQDPAVCDGVVAASLQPFRIAVDAADMD